MSSKRRSVQKLDLPENRIGCGYGSTSLFAPLFAASADAMMATMRLVFDPFRLLLVSLAGWLNQHQQDGYFCPTLQNGKISLAV